MAATRAVKSSVVAIATSSSWIAISAVEVVEVVELAKAL